MLSIILYGRNDSYGYNLHKRAALSLNCMAELLTGDDDEILFVDYNTPDDHPSFPEAIRDTLTAAARQRLRIFRVRPAQHALFRGRTHLPTLEPHARNVALRRSNPANRWVLSTNTDMIFVPRGERSLTEIAASRTSGFYHLPRFELPETLWEELDRMDPPGVIAAVGRWGWDLHLNEIVYGFPSILYDAPGDFQLMARADLFRIHGFDERMMLGWHVDSNIARRLGLLHGAPGTLVDELFGYHCDHTRQVTLLHRPDRVENDIGRFVDDVTAAAVSEQADEWGFAETAIEEIRLPAGPSRYYRSLHAAIGEAMPELSSLRYLSANYDRVGYDSRHVIPFLVDALSSYRRDISLGWIGASPDLLRRFALAWRELGFVGPILVPGETDWLAAQLPESCVPADWTAVGAQADVLVVDFGPSPLAEGADPSQAPSIRVLRHVAQGFRRMVMAERERLLGGTTAPRRFIAVNAVHGRFESLVRSHLSAATAPIATRLRQGHVRPEPDGPIDLLPLLSVGGAGRRDGAVLHIPLGARGHAFYGPYNDLMPGRYRLRLVFDPVTPGNAATEVMSVEVISGAVHLAHQPITGAALAAGEVVTGFEVSPELAFYTMSLRLEVRLSTTGLATARLTAASLERLSATASPDPEPFDWLRLMVIGSAGLPLAPLSRWRALLRPQQGRLGGRALREPVGVVARRSPGNVLVGPYCQLPPGRYALEVDLAPVGPALLGNAIADERIILEVHGSDGSLLARQPVPARRLDGTRERLEFTLPDRQGGAEGMPITVEFRVRTTGRVRFVVRGIRTKALELLPIEAPAGVALQPELAG